MNETQEKSLDLLANKVFLRYLGSFDEYDSYEDCAIEILGLDLYHNLKCKQELLEKIDFFYKFNEYEFAKTTVLTALSLWDREKIEGENISAQYEIEEGLFYSLLNFLDKKDEE